jgi:hypothetical protein
MYINAEMHKCRNAEMQKCRSAKYQNKGFAYIWILNEPIECVKEEKRYII